VLQTSFSLLLFILLVLVVYDSLVLRVLGEPLRRKGFGLLTNIATYLFQLFNLSAELLRWLF
jgi:hypothetical protein